MKFILSAMIFVVLLSTTVVAQTTNGGSIGTDSIFYKWEVRFDNFMVNVGLKQASSIAKERLAEIEEAQLLDDVKGMEIAKQALDNLQSKVTDEEILEQIEQTNEDIKQYADFTEQELILAINEYSQIQQLTKDVDNFYVQTTGLEKKIYVISIAMNKVVSIKEVSTLPTGTVYIKVAYSEILLILKDTKYKEIKLNQLLKLKEISSYGSQTQDNSEETTRGY